MSIGPYVATFNCGCSIAYEVEQIGKMHRCAEHGSMLVLPVPANLNGPVAAAPPRLAEVTAIRAPDELAIRMLEEMLAKARAGEIERLVVVGYNEREGCFGRLRRGDSYALIGYLHAVTQCMATDIGAVFQPLPKDPAS